MWEKLSLPWQACLDLAWESYCDDCYPIGAIITDPEGEIISRGRNYVYPQKLWTGPMPGVDLAHAEMEALNQLDYMGIDPHTCTLYTSLEPCLMCMSAFYMSGLRTLYYAARDAYAGSVEILGRTWYLSRKPIQVHGPSLELETIVLGIVLEQEFRKYDGAHPYPGFFERYQQEIPLGVEFGRKLYELDLLEQLRHSGASAEKVFDQLSALVPLKTSRV
jgi:tRNA(adenine34) deaminase